MTRGLLFAGAFNPVTQAHIDCAKLALESTGYDYVLFMPSKQEYIRFDQKKDYVFSDETRLALLNKVAENNAWMKVSDFEITSDRQPRTYRTLCALKEMGYDCSLLFGSDKLQEFSTAWLYTEEIATQFGIACMSRNSLSTKEIIDGDPLLVKLQDHITCIQIPDVYQDMSSSRIRALLKENRWDDAKLLLPEELRAHPEMLREMI